MTKAELGILQSKLLSDVLSSMDALADARKKDGIGNDLYLLKAIGQEGLTLSYRCSMLTGVLKLLAGKADDLTKTERGLLGRNARIRPLIPDADGGDGDE
jgi:hypothetical protein